MHNIVIIGNQFLSRAIIQNLAQDNNLSLTILTYENQTPYLPSNVQASSITYKATDFSLESLSQTLQGQDLAISTLSAGDGALQRRIVDSCIAAGVKRFIPNEFGLDSQNMEVQAMLPSYKARHELIQYLRSVEHRLQWVAIAVGTILDHELQNGKLGFDLKWHSASIPGQSASMFSVTSLKRVGELAAAIISHWDAVHNSYLYNNGCLTSVDEVVRCLENETDTKWAVDYNEPTEMQKSAQKMLDSGWPDAGWMLTERIAVFGHELSVAAGFSETTIARLGMEAESVADIVHQAVHEWNHSAKGDCGCA